MKIDSIRLKNIKSYAEGADGAGITVIFQPGVNRVAGRNGHGKTTLIEALGYALFFADPDFEERFGLSTYFLRAGEKEGEIDVVFTHNSEQFRLERALGQGKRRSKVIQIADGSTCAENDDDVSNFLCRLLGFKDRRQLSDLFCNLIGIKQGRLTWPFDSKPAAAKEFFEPLLDVEIFRRSASDLGQIQGQFRNSLEEQNVKLAAVQERIRERADSPQKVVVKEKQVEVLTKALEKSRAQKEEADRQKQLLEAKQTASNSAKTALEEAKHRLGLEIHKRETDQQRLNESEAAAAVVTKTEPGFVAFDNAEQRLRGLQQQLHEKTLLQKQRAEAANTKTEWETKMGACRQQARDYQEQRDERARLALGLGQQLARGSQGLQKDQVEFERLSGAVSEAKRARNGFESWLETLNLDVRRNASLVDEVLKDCEKIEKWDGHALAKARAEEQRLEQAARALARKLAKSEEAKETLAAQLEKIRGGVCPFLKEKCRQFDPKAIQSDLHDHEDEIRQIGKQQKEAAEAHSESRKTVEKLAAKEAGIDHLRDSIQKKVHAFVDQHNELLSDSVQKNLQVARAWLSADVEWDESLVTATLETLNSKSVSGVAPQRLQALAHAERDFLKRVSMRISQIVARLDERFDQFEKQRQERLRQERDLDNVHKNLDKAEAELKQSATKLDQLLIEANKAETQANAATKQILLLDEKLKPFANLEVELREQTAIKEKTAVDHKTYLGSKPIAEKLYERQEALKKSSARETHAREQVQHKTEFLELARRDFDPAALETAQRGAVAADIKLATDAQTLKEAERSLKEEKERFKQLREAEAERDNIENEINRLVAASDLARMAARVLKDAAPAVAQHLCSRIAANGQRIFNQINQEPIELEWKAEPHYGLRIVPGDRRFAMLSGGEQTKLALAMTLAMIQEFSGLRFAVFDEPTYAVDADSRQKLADAILDAQKAAALEQLIIVSHDDAFEGKIENVVMLRKNAATGTQVVA